MPLSLGRKLLLSSVSEAAFREQVRRWAEERGWLVYFTWNSQHSPAGFPDLVLCRPPQLRTVELKRVGGRLSVRQHVWDIALGEVTDYAHLGVWTPLDEEDIQEALA